MDEKESTKLVKRGYFNKVATAREALAARSYELVKLQLRIIKLALRKGDHETAAKANQFLMEHVIDAEGNRPIGPSVDKKVEQVEAGKSGPAVQIGFNIGGLLPGQTQPQTQPVVIDITPITDGKPDKNPI